MIWICAVNSVDNRGMFVAIAEQCLHIAKAFSASHTVPPGRMLGVHKKLGGDIVRDS